MKIVSNVYEEPQVVVIKVEVEQGFAQSVEKLGENEGEW